MYADVKKQPRSAEDTSAIHPTAGNRDKPTKAPKPVKVNINDGVKQVASRPGNIELLILIDLLIIMIIAMFILLYWNCQYLTYT